MAQNFSQSRMSTACKKFAKEMGTRILLALCTPFLLPLVWYLEYRERHERPPRILAEQRKRRVERWEANAVKPLPAVRARALTMPFVPQAGQVTKEQSRSMLLAKLPWELRMMIYQEVLGGHVLHVMSVRKRLRCLANMPEAELYRQWYNILQQDGRHDAPKVEEVPPICLLSLITTCRQVYGYDL